MNLLWVRPRLRRDTASAEWLKRLLIGEAALAVLILAAVGMLTSLEPARQVASRELAQSRQSISFSDTVSTDNIQLEVSPGRVGSNDLTVTLTDRLGRPVSNADEVLVRLVFLESDLGDDTLTATSLGYGRYVGEDAQLSIAGVWQAELVVRRPDAFDARTAFRFEALSTGAAGSAAISPSPATAYLMLGAGLLVLGTLFLGAGLPLGGWFSPRRGRGDDAGHCRGGRRADAAVQRATRHRRRRSPAKPLPTQAGIAERGGRHLRPSLPDLPRRDRARRRPGRVCAGAAARRPGGSTSPCTPTPTCSASSATASPAPPWPPSAAS